MAKGTGCGICVCGHEGALHVDFTGPCEASKLEKDVWCCCFYFQDVGEKQNG